MVFIRVKEGETFEVAARRFKRAVEKSGILPEVRFREFCEPPSERRKRMIAAAIKRRCKEDKARSLPKRLY